MSHGNWNDLVIEKAARPQLLSGDRFREWISGKGIFISSRRDSEMNPVRDAVKQHLYGIGAHPIMWEEITPRDQAAEQAYLDGVDQSDLFVLLIGRSYGVTDSTGYSPIHKEYNRAKERKLPRLLFMLEGVQDAERDGRLNDWLLSLFKEISVASFSTPASFTSQLDMRLQEMAAQSSRFWIKLGNIVFPGSVKTESNASRNGNRFIVTAKVTQGGVRHALMSLGDRFSRSINRLTWADQSFAVQVDSVSTESEFTSENWVRVECSTPQNSQNSPQSHLTMMSVSGGVHGKSLGPADLALIWANRTVFGATSEIDSSVLDIASSLTKPDTIPLPEVLRLTQANGWIAEGLTRLYIVEELRQRYPGYFDHLIIGPATSQGVRVDSSFIIESHSLPKRKTVQLQGVVPVK